MRRKRGLCPAPAVLIVLAIVAAQGCGDTPSGPEAPQWETVAQEAVGPDGGRRAADGIEVIVPAGAFRSETVLSLQRPESDDYPIQDPRVSRLGQVFRVKGMPPPRAPITVTLTFDPAMLPPSDSCFVYLEEECHVSAADGWALRGHPLFGSVTDRSAGRVSATLPAEEAEPAKSKAQESGTPVLRDFTVTAGWFSNMYARSASGDFTVHWKKGQVDEAWIDDLISALEAAKARLEGYGLQFRNSENDVIEVEIRRLNPGRNGEFVQSKWGIDASYLVISPEVSSRLLRAAAGHELFHLLQMGYEVCGHYTGYDYLWLSEALSVWSEHVFLDDPDYVPNVQEDNRNFIHEPLETERTSHGYGASRFLRYLTDRYGDAIVPAILQAGRKRGRSGTGAAAFAEMLSARGTTLAEQFTGFARSYLTASAGHEGWSPADPELVVLKPKKTLRQVSFTLGDLSARHVNVGLDWGGKSVWGRLTVSRNADAGEHVRCFAYTASAASGPWVFQGEIGREEPYVIVDFGQDRKRWLKVIAVRAEGLPPYDRSDRVVLTCDFSPQLGFPVRFVHFKLYARGTDAAGQPQPILMEFVNFDAAMQDENTFTVDNSDSDEEAGWTRREHFTATMDFARERVLSWSYELEYHGATTEISASARGGELGAYYQTDQGALYEVKGEATCNHLTDVHYLRTHDGVLDRRADAPTCDWNSWLRIELRR